MNPGPAGRLEHVTFDVVGLEAADLAALGKVRWSAQEWAALFRVSADDRPASERGSGPALTGSYRLVDRVLRFTPEAPLEPATRYRAVFDASRLPGRAPGSDGTMETLFAPPPKAW
jgi:hypothetical protein